MSWINSIFTTRSTSTEPAQAMQAASEIMLAWWRLWGMLARLDTAIENAGGRLPQALATGLDDIETRELMETRDMRLAAALVHKGLENKGFVMLAA
ncbi:hypothetical protein [Thauera sp. 2A1]|uniref:hypothetical protein n=1 Tax=Thauera sp. 2A1 TaxID=2570191 RepID=UPI00188500DD|nr:hypothetical protein [Thauera sp. 2A1]KAI5912890.1 hypothetical protein GH664_20235 [Thauera sp. 2A1]